MNLERTGDARCVVLSNEEEQVPRAPGTHRRRGRGSRPGAAGADRHGPAVSRRYRRRLTAIREGVFLSVWTADALAADIRQEEQ